MPEPRHANPADAADPVWSAFRARWADLRPPLRPDGVVVAAITKAIAGHERRVLLLGVTPELVACGDTIVAVEHDQGMIAHVWPGDDDRARAVHADWRDMALPGPRFTAAIGDGSLNCVAWPDDAARVLARIAALVEPDARIALRIYVAPDEREPLDDLRRLALTGGLSFHAFKWRPAMALREEDGNVALDAIHRAFQAMFADRATLSAVSGWSLGTIAEIDAYADSSGRFAFPARAQIEAVVPGSFAPPRFIGSGDYPLAERCPLMVTARLA